VLECESDAARWVDDDDDAGERKRGRCDSRFAGAAGAGRK
jgi:hypothetical protein